MESAPDGHEMGGGSTVSRIELDAAVADFISLLDERRVNRIEFTDRDDAILLATWRDRRYKQEEIAKKLGYAVSTCRRRFMEINNEMA